MTTAIFNTEYGYNEPKLGRKQVVREELDWQSIKNRPKTIAGYGITDAAGKNQLETIKTEMEGKIKNLETKNTELERKNEELQQKIQWVATKNAELEMKIQEIESRIP